jgi:gag-polypeptide of LTR copia-type
LQIIKIEKNDDILIYIGKFESICNQLIFTGMTVEEKDKVITFLLSLPPHYNIVRTQIEFNTDSHKLKYEKVKNTVVAYTD